MIVCDILQAREQTPRCQSFEAKALESPTVTTLEKRELRHVDASAPWAFVRPAVGGAWARGWWLSEAAKQSVAQAVIVVMVDDMPPCA